MCFPNFSNPPAPRQERRVNNMAPRPFVPSWDMSEANKRLLLLAANLDIADERHLARGEPTYDQTEITHDCGTPACAMGHNDYLYREASRKWQWRVHWEEVNFFDMLENEAAAMFGRYGCNRAKTAKQAADYIRDFAMTRHRRELMFGRVVA
jgi:hypothetical protein